MSDEMKKHVETLIAKAAEHHEEPLAAMQLAQAALNAVNALLGMDNLKK